MVNLLGEGQARFFVSTDDGGANFRARAKEFGFDSSLVKDEGKVLGTEVIGSLGDVKEVLIEKRTNLTLVIK